MSNQSSGRPDRVSKQRLQSPDIYLKSKSATILAILKLLEALLAGFAFYCIIINPDAIKDAINSSFEGLSDEVQSYHPIFNFVTNYSQIILAIELAFIILDGLGAFFMRLVRKGAGLVIFSHSVRRIFTIIAFIFCAFFFFQFHRAWKEVTSLANTLGPSYYTTLTGITSFQLYSAMVLILGSLLLLISYDHYVSVVMKHVSSEVEDDRIKQYTKKNRLGIESAIFAVLLGVNAALSIISYFGGNDVLSKVNQSLADLYTGSNLISIGVGLLLAIKFFFVNRSSSEFNKAHRTKKANNPEIEKELKKELLQESKMKYTGISAQPIGQIPSGSEVTLSLNPDSETLIISYKHREISLPYDRITSFTVDYTSSDKTNKILKDAQDYLSNTDAIPTGADPLGMKKMATGLAGNVTSNLIPQNKVIYAVSTLSYVDKDGNPQQLQFSKSQETGYGINKDDAFHDDEAQAFSKAVHTMKSRYAENITEL